MCNWYLQKKLFGGRVYTLGKSNAFFRRSAFHREFITDSIIYTYENNWGDTLGRINLLNFRFIAQCVKNESKATIDTPDYARGG